MRKKMQIEKMLEDFKFSKKSREKEPKKELPQPQNIKNFQSVPTNLDSNLIIKKSMVVTSPKENSPKKALQDQEDIQIKKEGNERIDFIKNRLAEIKQMINEKQEPISSEEKYWTNAADSQPRLVKIDPNNMNFFSKKNHDKKQSDNFPQNSEKVTAKIPHEKKQSDPILQKEQPFFDIRISAKINDQKPSNIDFTNIVQERPYFSEQTNAPKIVYLRLPIEDYHSQKIENLKQLAVKIEKPIECSTEPVKHIMTQQEQNKYFMENFLRIPQKSGNQPDQTKNKTRNIDVSLKNKKGNLLKEEIKRLDQEIKHEEIEKTKELVTLQNILNSRIAEKSKSSNLKNPQNMNILNDLCNEKTNLKTEPLQYQSVKNLTQKQQFEKNRDTSRSGVSEISKKPAQVQLASTSAKNLRPSQESLRNSFMLRSSKIFINDNNHCVILDPQNLIENIRNSTMKMSQKIAQTTA